MEDCPHCGSGLQGSVRMESTRNETEVGGKSRQTDLVTCPDCGQVIDGFTEH
ncbi:MAG: hypothetical protein ABEJ04_04590 [Halobacteriaceae archaeon]